MSLETPPPITRNPEIPDDVLEQLENLGLTPELVDGRVLDIGAREAEFAAAFSGKDSARIVSVDQFVPPELAGAVVEADAANLPFGDGSFDLVVAHASVPNVFIGDFDGDNPAASGEKMSASVERAFGEALRVLRPGGTARFAPVRLGENYASELALKAAVLSAVEKLRRDPALETSFEMIRLRQNPQNSEQTEEWRLVVRKLPAAA